MNVLSILFMRHNTMALVSKVGGNKKNKKARKFSRQTSSQFSCFGEFFRCGAVLVERGVRPGSGIGQLDRLANSRNRG